jgi:hypothetical protein
MIKFPLGEVEKAPEQADFVTQVTKSTEAKSPQEAKLLTAFERAKAAAHDLSSLDNGQKAATKEYREKAETQGRTAILEMLLVAECFLKEDGTIDMEGMHSFLATQSPNGKLHKGADNPWQPLARMCFPKKAGGTVTKFGYVLAALDTRKIRFERAEKEYSEPEMVGTPPTIKKGMRKYIFLFHEDNRPENEEPKDPFEDWNKDRLKNSAMFFLKKLYENGLISSRVVNVKEILSEKALS